MEIGNATAGEIPELASIWFNGWQDAHADILPLELKQDRTRESFEKRLQSLLPNIRVAGVDGAPAGFSIVKEDELYQLYVSARARGSGVAAALVRDAETRLAQSGVKTAWLACAIGNDRAARFYEKCGWRRTGTMTSHLETSDGIFPLDVWRYEIDLPA